MSLSLGCGYLALRDSNHSSPSPDPTQAWLRPGLCNLCVNLGVSWMCHPLGPFLSSSVTLPNLHNVSTRQRGTAVHPWSQNPTISQKLALLHGPSSTNYLKKQKKTFLPPAKSRAMLFPAHQQGFLTTEPPSYWQGRENEKRGNLISSHYADLI